MRDLLVKFIAFLPVAFFLATSCASQRDVISLNNQLGALYRQTRKETRRLEQSMEKLGQEIKADDAERKKREKAFKEDQNSLKEGQESLRLQLAQLGADLGGIRENIGTLTGRVEENSHLLKSTIEGDITKEDAMVSQMRQISSRVDELNIRIGKIEDYFGLEASAKGKKMGPEKAAPAQEMGEKDIPGPEKKKLAESAIYERALGCYREGRYVDAIGMFEDFVKLYPKSDLADNAHFWIGESHKDLRKYEEAILAYQRVINDYPGGNKVPAAMLQQAFAFEKISDKTTANLVLKKLVKQFPQTREGEIARSKLKQD